jgi:RNA polymerase sigma factor (sigma-70 family)
MSLRTDLKSLDELASRLPFHLDDTNRVNEAYCAYKNDHAGDGYVVDLWTYCYIRRYYLIKFISEAAFRAVELDQVVERTYRKVERSRYQLEQDDRYAQWVSVICRNTYVNFVTRRRIVTTLEEEADIAPPPRVSGSPEDAGALYLALSRAIERLPAFLHSVARMRFVEDLSYEEISRLTGKSVPVIRAYVHKICRRFREDPGLKAFKDGYG